MQSLSENWLTEGWVDFEYKKYILLAYLQGVERAFSESKIYPYMSDLVVHYKNLKSISEKKTFLQHHFPKKLSGADLENFKLMYRQEVHDDETLQVLEDIIEYAIPLMSLRLEDGKHVYDFLESNITLSPVGIAALRQDAGFLFVSHTNSKITDIYEYSVSVFQSADETYRGIHTKLLEQRRRHLGESYENIKVSLVKEMNYVNTPATYLVESKVHMPVEESMLPIAKRMLVRHLAAA